MHVITCKMFNTCTACYTDNTQEGKKVQVKGKLFQKEKLENESTNFKVEVEGVKEERVKQCVCYMEDIVC